MTVIDFERLRDRVDSQGERLVRAETRLDDHSQQLARLGSVADTVIRIESQMGQFAKDLAAFGEQARVDRVAAEKREQDSDDRRVTGRRWRIAQMLGVLVALILFAGTIAAAFIGKV